MGDDTLADNCKPQRIFILDAYYIYKRPVTVAQYRYFCNENKAINAGCPCLGLEE